MKRIRNSTKSTTLFSIQSVLTPETFVNRRMRRLPMKRIYTKGEGLHYKVKRSFDLLLRQIGRQQKANTNERQLMQKILFNPVLKDKIYQIIMDGKWKEMVYNETRDKRKMGAIKRFVIQMESQFLKKYGIEQKKVQSPTGDNQQEDMACQQQSNSSNNICQIDS